LCVSDPCQIKRTASMPVEKEALLSPMVSTQSGGVRGPDTAAWLLAAYSATHSPRPGWPSRKGVRLVLQNAWRNQLEAAAASGDIDGTRRAFVQQRLSQVPEVALEEKLDEQVLVALGALLHGDADEELEETSAQDSVHWDGRQSDAAPGQPQPYRLLPGDWARLSEAYSVDFVLHDVPGSENYICNACGCSGHVHTGAADAPQLHVAWRQRPGKAQCKLGCPTPREPVSGFDLPFAEPEAELSPDGKTGLGAAEEPNWPQQTNSDLGAACAHWEPLGSGPLLPRLDDVKMTPACASGKVQVFSNETVAEVVTEHRSGSWGASHGLGCVSVSAVCACGDAGSSVPSSCTEGRSRPEEAICPTQTACPTRGACLAGERPPSDDVLPPAPLPATAMGGKGVTEIPMKERSEGTEEGDIEQALAAWRQVPGAASLVLAPLRLDRSLTKDDWLDGDVDAKEASDSTGASFSGEPALTTILPAPATPKPGEEGYVDTGGGILSFLLLEDEDEEGEVLREDESADQAASQQWLGRGARTWTGVSRSGPSPLASIQETDISRGTEG